MGHLFEESFGCFQCETAGVDLVLWKTVSSETELTQLMQECFEQVPSNDGVEVDFIDFVGEDRVVVFPTFFNTQEEVLDSVCVLELIKPGPVNEFVIKGLSGHVVFNFILFFNDVGFGESVRELGSFVDLIEVVVIETVDVEGLGFRGLLILDGLLKPAEEVLDQFVGV